MRILRALLGDDSARSEIASLRKRLDESEKRIEKLISVTDNLIKLGDDMSKDIMSIASHVALITMIMSEYQENSEAHLKAPSDDSLIN